MSLNLHVLTVICRLGTAVKRWLSKLQFSKLISWLTVHVSPCSWIVWLSNTKAQQPTCESEVWWSMLIICSSINRGQQMGENIPPVAPNSPQSDETLGVMGMSRSTTCSPVPPSVQSTAWISCRRMIYIKTSPPSGHWPVPEAFWPDPSIQTMVIFFLLAFIDCEQSLFFSRERKVRESENRAWSASEPELGQAEVSRTRRYM